MSCSKRIFLKYYKVKYDLVDQIAVSPFGRSLTYLELASNLAKIHPQEFRTQDRINQVQSRTSTTINKNERFQL